MKYVIYKNQRGFTLIELLIVLFIIGVMVVIVLGGLVSMFGGPSPEEIHTHCKKQANEYAASTGRPIFNTSCMDNTPFWSSYVTATIFYADHTQLELDCALPGNYGCKPAK